MAGNILGSQYTLTRGLGRVSISGVEVHVRLEVWVEGLPSSIYYSSSLTDSYKLSCCKCAENEIRCLQVLVIMLNSKTKCRIFSRIALVGVSR